MADRTPFYDFLEDDEMASYFNSLPPYVQETIKQSHSDITTLSQLKNIAENLTEDKN